MSYMNVELHRDRETPKDSGRVSPKPRVSGWWTGSDTLPDVQTRYLILASLATGLIILAATALWFSTL
jgi:hypothetical protein